MKSLDPKLRHRLPSDDGEVGFVPRIRQGPDNFQLFWSLGDNTKGEGGEGRVCSRKTCEVRHASLSTMCTFRAVRKDDRMLLFISDYICSHFDLV